MKISEEAKSLATDAVCLCGVDSLLDCDKIEQISEAIQKAFDAHDATKWQPIETAPKDTFIDTFGMFYPTHSCEQKGIRLCDDYISSNTPYPRTTTQHMFGGMYGNYTRTHWMPPPDAPKEQV